MTGGRKPGGGVTFAKINTMPFRSARKSVIQLFSRLYQLGTLVHIFLVNQALHRHGQEVFICYVSVAVRKGEPARVPNQLPRKWIGGSEPENIEVLENT